MTKLTDAQKIAQEKYDEKFPPLYIRLDKDINDWIKEYSEDYGIKVKEAIKIAIVFLKENSDVGQLRIDNNLLKEEVKQLRIDNNLLKEEVKQLRIDNNLLKEENDLLKGKENSDRASAREDSDRRAKRVENCAELLCGARKGLKESLKGLFSK